MRAIFGGLFFLFTTTLLLAQKVVEEQGLKTFFTQRGLDGCFVVLDPQKDVLHVYNPERAKVRFRPASTFKIPNALIGLDVGAVQDLDEILPYGGTKEWMKTWEKDMNLRDAMKISNVAVFHQLAKRIGLERMQDRLTAFQYGNALASKDIEIRFWLDGPLEISALEQVDFLHRLVSGKVPVKAETLESVKTLIQYDKKSGVAIYGKTGWLGSKGTQVGWWVGWVEKEGQSYPFALNARIKSLEDAKHRIPIALDCLQKLGYW
ncbi:class D beta-lactamase [Prosthecobacter dejongeii]|uniref:Beta-lactamase n=1 Tax=Prosthecobacter dejongeii TaxID=48465 RepID=A0A7W7YQU0_9BACT|nr:class D beta-lactamase [Prosthecobacter dejongeii]MBB5040425.1 beta-lactamase class D [Prosthecobacter dejongeii]